jgi:hypothetical protein
LGSKAWLRTDPDLGRSELSAGRRHAAGFRDDSHALHPLRAILELPGKKAVISLRETYRSVWRNIVFSLQLARRPGESTPEEA